MMTKTSPKMGLIPALIILIMLAFCCQTALAINGEPGIETDRRIYQGEDIRVHFYNAPGYASDWICIVPEGAPDTEGGDYKYMPAGVRQGVLNFRSPRPGRYEARAYYNYRTGGYLVSARYRFKVEDPGHHPLPDPGYDEPGPPPGHRGQCVDRCRDDFQATLAGCREHSNPGYQHRCKRQAKERERHCIDRCSYR
ncbi:MAG: hypothetical protein ACYDGO_05965 [Smithellaceae bacterium]